MVRILLIAACCLTATRMEAAEDMVRLFPKPGGSVSVAGKNTVHDWVVLGSDIGGWIEFAPGLFDRPDEALLKRPAKVRGEVMIPVRSLRSSDGLTKSLHQLLKEATHPQIKFNFQDTRIQTIRVGGETVYRLDAQGPLVAGGATNELTVPIDVFPLGEQRYRLVGKTPLKMSDYSIQPPVLKTSGGEVKYRDDVEVSFEWIVGPKRNGRQID
jgi:YceI-like protein